MKATLLCLVKTCYLHAWLQVAITLTDSLQLDEIDKIVAVCWMLTTADKIDNIQKIRVCIFGCLHFYLGYLAAENRENKYFLENPYSILTKFINFWNSYFSGKICDNRPVYMKTVISWTFVWSLSFKLFRVFLFELTLIWLNTHWSSRRIDRGLVAPTPFDFNHGTVMRHCMGIWAMVFFFSEPPTWRPDMWMWMKEGYGQFMVSVCSISHLYWGVCSVILFPVYFSYGRCAWQLEQQKSNSAGG